MTPAQRRNFDRLLNPRHIAFIGGQDAAIAIGEARRRGFMGDYWAVNPRRDTLAGVPCVPTIADLPDTPDAVYLAIPSSGVIDAVKDLAARGAGGIVCYSAGFKEAHAEGAALEEKLKAAVGDMALIGPNCYGLINYMDNVALWPFAHGGDCPGYGAAIITQSGMFSSDITMSQRSLPLAYMVSGGNQTVLGIEDFIEAFAEKPNVRAIGVHIEGLRDIPQFERAALKALDKGIPLVAFKTGNSAIGASLTVSHTGSLSGTRDLYDALFRRVGAISVDNPSQFIETLKYLCIAGAPNGKSVAGFTCSGGGATMLADRVEEIGLDFPGFTEPEADTLNALLPPIATLSNPLDYTTPIWGQPEHTHPVFNAAMSRGSVASAILVQDYPAAGLDESLIFYRNDAEAFARAASEHALPAAICSTIHENMDAATRAFLIDHGVAPMQGIHEALNAIRDAATWHADKTRILADTPAPVLGDLPTHGASPVDEATGKAWLQQNGLPVPVSRTATYAELAQVAEELSFPVALKLLSAEILHKTEAGTVALNIPDTASLLATAEAMRDRTGTAYTDRFLIEQMAPKPIAELIIGIRQEPQFGLAMTIGAGGIFTELLKDATTLLLPTTAQDIYNALASLRIAPLLQGFRGAEEVDLETLSKTLESLAHAAVTDAETLAEIEINPLFVYPTQCLSIDALCRTTFT